MIFDEIMNERDEYFVLADFDSYVKAQEKIQELYRDRKLWNKMCLMNIVNSSFFTSDRAIKSTPKKFGTYKRSNNIFIEGITEKGFLLIKKNILCISK